MLSTLEKEGEEPACCLGLKGKRTARAVQAHGESRARNSTAHAQPVPTLKSEPFKSSHRRKSWAHGIRNQQAAHIVLGRLS